jgi:hypothetical protein
MNALLVPIVLLLTTAPLMVRADESPAAPESPTSTTSVEAEQLPYGAGYEARRRAAELRHQQRTRGDESATGQEHARTQAARPAETRTARRDADRAATRQEARRQARERWGAHGGRRN